MIASPPDYWATEWKARNREYHRISKGARQEALRIPLLTEERAL
jgi:hypothetical protein